MILLRKKVSHKYTLIRLSETVEDRTVCRQISTDAVGTAAENSYVVRVDKTWKPVELPFLVSFFPSNRSQTFRFCQTSLYNTAAELRKLCNRKGYSRIAKISSTMSHSMLSCKSKTTHVVLNGRSYNIFRFCSPQAPLTIFSCHHRDSASGIPLSVSYAIGYYRTAKGEELRNQFYISNYTSSDPSPAHSCKPSSRRYRSLNRELELQGTRVSWK
ncbi:hypothetical protein BDQ17DRAFT_685835 [Cyathus striatus]|nr:hypothetical protein BDQ17DRAFT_685835 [Cyathus striatus]